MASEYTNPFAFCGESCRAQRSTSRFCTATHRAAWHRHDAEKRLLPFERDFARQTKSIALLKGDDDGLLRAGATLTEIHRRSSRLPAVA